MARMEELSDGLPNVELVPTDVGKLAVRSVGTGRRTIVLWPSIFTDHRIFDGVVKRLGHRFRFILIDGPGHGDAEGAPHPFSMRDCGHAMLQVMDAYGVPDAVLGGVSWGGIAAAEAALLSPGRVQATVLMNTPMRIGLHGPSLADRFIAAGARRSVRMAVFRNGVARSFFGPEENAPPYFHMMLRQVDRVALSRSVRSVLFGKEPLMPRLANVAAPSLVVAGRDDRMYPVTTAAEAALRLPHGRFEIVAGGHISPVAAPDAVRDILTRFLQKELGS